MARHLEQRKRPQQTETGRLAASVAKLARHRRDVILEAIALSARELLRSSDLWQSLTTVIERIGQATDVDRVHVFKVDRRRPTDRGAIANHHVWSAPGASTPRDFSATEADMADVGLASWTPRLAGGEIIAGHVRDFDDDARRLFDGGGVKSVLAVPIFADDRWWGFFGFDDCRCESDWSTADLDTFRTLAELVGAAVARMDRTQTLADSNRIVENCPTLLYRLSAQPPFPLIYLSQNIRRYGYRAEDLLSSPGDWMRMIGSEAHPTIAADIKALLTGEVKSTLVELRVTTADGADAWFEGRGYLLRDERGRPLAIEGILTDITERKAASEKIAAMARTDYLTGLANRAAFVDRLNLAIAHAKRTARPFAVLYLDLDHFKDVNDTLGHTAGDALLQAVADRLHACVRETDLVSRFGGDEFAILLDEMADVDGLAALATKIGGSIADSFSIQGNQIHVTASIGVVPYHEDIEGPEAVMQKADLALYRAKDEGRNQFQFHVTHLDEEVLARVTLGEELRTAIDREELELFYQPQVELSSSRIVGMEALIRWNHPTRGVLPPAEFIPVAESNGAIDPIGRWVIRETCRQIKSWGDRGISPPVVAANVSAMQFKLVRDLDRIVADCLAEYGVDPGQLELELTESVLMDMSRKHGATLKRLRRMGVRLAIDDFGTGYSSFDYLRSFRVARLKIDRRFIEGATTRPEDATILRAMVNLAHNLDIEPLAEGVETAEQAAFLISDRCNFAQGFYFGKPMPAAAATALLSQEFEQAK